MNNYYGSFGYNNMPNPNIPFNNSFNPYTQNYQNQQANNQQPLTNTNKIFVASVDDVKNRPLPFNSDFMFLDNDKPILYQKIVDSKGQFEIKTFDITPHIDEQKTKDESVINPANYVLKSDFEALQGEIRSLKDKFTKMSIQSQIDSMKKGENSNGTK